MISRQDCMKKIASVEEVEKSESNKFIFSAIYKAIVMCLHILLDIRANQHWISKKMGFKQGEKE